MTEQQQRKFRTILADPPWNIHQSMPLGAARHYDLMTLDDIKAMPIEGLAEDNAHLWLWTTNAALEATFDVVRAWGFQPRSILTWVKPRFQLGNYLRNATEQLIFATRGKAPVLFKAQPTWAFMPLQEHSHKPEEQFAIIERVSPGPYLELFARRRPPSDKDWSIWGFEAPGGSDITISGYPVPSDSLDKESRP
jgi:N6-adenosine-specific RNA methylase IME4